jgi:major membrane immunogen (membrane-anchored lipoprotein)
MKQISDKLIGKQIPIAFVKEEKKDDKKSDKIIVPGLNDGVYYAQRLYDDRNRYIDYVEMEVKNGIITKVKWDAFSTDKTNQDRSEAALKGAYVVNGLDWATQSYNICHALLECQDPDRLAMKSDGTTDIVKGVTCDIRPFIELTMECIANSRASYDKEKYMIGLDMILLHLFQKDAEDLEYLNDDGHVVFSFEKNPEIYTVYNDENVAIGYMGVMKIEAKIRGITLPNTGDYTNTQTGNTNADKSGTGAIEYDGAEDGLSSGSSTDDQIFTESLDDLPMTEMASFIEPLSDRYDQIRTVVKACNTCYKFLKEYLNWKVT